jgi:hypothetical protein
MSIMRGRGSGGRCWSDLGTVLVVMPGVLGEDDPQVAFPEDQHSVGAFAAGGAHPAFGDRVRPWRLRRCLDDLDVGRGEHVVEPDAEFGVAVAGEEPQPVSAFVQVHEHVPGLLDHPRAVRVGGEAGEVDSAAGDLDEEQYVYPPEEYSVDREEVAGQHGFRLRG